MRHESSFSTIQLLCSVLLFKNVWPIAGAVAWQTNPVPVVLAFRMGISLSTSFYTSDTAPSQWPGKMEEDGPSPWVPAPTREFQKQLLASSFGPAQLWALEPFGN